MKTARRSRIEPFVDLRQIYTQRFGEGQIATDGVVYSGVVTIGTGNTDILDILINPGMAMRLDSIQVGLTQAMAEITDADGSLTYFWQMRSEGALLGTGGPIATTMGFANLSGNLEKGVASLSSNEDTLSGYIVTGSVPRLPARLKLTASAALLDDQITGKVKNSSFVRFEGTVIPGV